VAEVTRRASDGGPPAAIWNRRVWRIAGPVILSNMSVPLLGAVDTAVVGHLPDPVFIGAVGIGSLIFNFLYWGFGFLRMGTTGLTAQAWGARDVAEVRGTLARALMLGLVIGGLILLLQRPILWLALALIEASAEVERETAVYYQVRVWAAPATLAGYAVFGWLFGLQRAMAVLLLQLSVNGVNVVLDLVFVLGFGWGVGGVALATVISQYLGLGLGLLIVARSRPAAGRLRWPVSPGELARVRRMLTVNGDIFLRTLALLFCFAVFMAESAKMGDVVLAANTVLMNLQTLTAHGLDGFAHAAEALVGAAVGAGRRQALRAVVRTTTGWALALAGGFTLIYGLWGSALVGLITDIEAVRAASATYLVWIVVLPLLSVWSFQLDGIFIGATRSAEMRNGALVSVAVFLLAAALLVPIWGNHGLWAALVAWMAGRAAPLALWYPRIERALAPPTDRQRHGARGA
jgi:MATE family multidrug resistance protein